MEPYRVLQGSNRSGFIAVGTPTVDGTLTEQPSRYTLVQSSLCLVFVNVLPTFIDDDM